MRCQKKPKNKHDKNAVAVIRDSSLETSVVGHSVHKQSCVIAILNSHSGSYCQKSQSTPARLYLNGYEKAVMLGSHYGGSSNMVFNKFLVISNNLHVTVQFILRQLYYWKIVLQTND